MSLEYNPGAQTPEPRLLDRGFLRNICQHKSEDAELRYPDFFTEVGGSFPAVLECRWWTEGGNLQLLMRSLQNR